MVEGIIKFSVNDMLNYVKPVYLESIFALVFIIVLVISLAILYHLNKYREHNPVTIIVELVYLFGIISLFFLAFSCVVLYSK